MEVLAGVTRYAWKQCILVQRARDAGWPYQKGWKAGLEMSKKFKNTCLSDAEGMRYRALQKIDCYEICGLAMSKRKRDNCVLQCTIVRIIVYSTAKFCVHVLVFMF